MAVYLWIEHRVAMSNIGDRKLALIREKRKSRSDWLLGCLAQRLN